MSSSHKIPAALVTTIAAIAIAAPAAGAQPIHDPSEFGLRHSKVDELDAGHAALATAMAKRQDLRSADAKDAAVLARHHSAPLASAPVWPANPVTLHAVQAPVNNDDDTPWLTIVLGVAGAGLVAGGAAAGISRTSRSRTRARAVA